MIASTECKNYFDGQKQRRSNLLGLVVFTARPLFFAIKTTNIIDPYEELRRLKNLRVCKLAADLVVSIPLYPGGRVFEEPIGRIKRKALHFCFRTL